MTPTTPATPAAVREGKWIEWCGGKCPMAPGVQHERRYRDGFTGIYRQASGVQRNAWVHAGDENDIVAYRLVRS